MSEPVHNKELHLPLAIIKRWVEKMPTPTPERFMAMRIALGDLQRKCPDRIKPLPQMAIFYLKNRFLSDIQKMQEAGEKSRHPILTDHAFVRSLERLYGIDVMALKDHVLTDIRANRTFEKITADTGQIITVFKKVGA